jgi:hypothetical protein
VINVPKYLSFIYYIAAPSCSATPGPAGLLLNRTTGPLVWTSFAYNYTALSTVPTLVFGFSGGGSVYNYLDDVSVVDNNASSIQLLNNPSFESSTSTLTGWTAWCATASVCGTGYPGRITNSSCHSGNCYIDHCHQTNYDYLVQSFSATIGHTYTISFWLQQTGTGTFKFDATVQN